MFPSFFFQSLSVGFLMLTSFATFAKNDYKTTNNNAPLVVKYNDPVGAEVQKLYAEALSAYNANDLKRAEKGFDKVLSVDDKHWRAHLNLGQIHLINKQVEKAFAAFYAAKKIKPNDAVLYYDIAVMEGNCKYYDVAINSFSEAIALDSTFAKAYSSRAELYRITKDYVAARVDLAKAKKLDKTITAINFTSAQMLLDEKKYKLALEQLDVVCFAYPNQVLPSFLRGTALLELKKYKGAEADFSKVLLLDPQHAAAYTARGRARVALGMSAESCEDFAQAAELGNADAKNLLRELCK
jgi:tetratricopeptide (TPR) repeat protein